MREIKFRCYVEGHFLVNEGKPTMIYNWEGSSLIEYVGFIPSKDQGFELMQYTGLKDENEKDIYEGDIGEFPNGDRFVIGMEDWLEICIDWIGDPECEDQARDLYRISRSKIIGNVHENPVLIENANKL